MRARLDADETHLMQETKMMIALIAVLVLAMRANAAQGACPGASNNQCTQASGKPSGGVSYSYYYCDSTGSSAACGQVAPFVCTAPLTGPFSDSNCSKALNASPAAAVSPPPAVVSPPPAVASPSPKPPSPVPPPPVPSITCNQFVNFQTNQTNQSSFGPYRPSTTLYS